MSKLNLTLPLPYIQRLKGLSQFYNLNVSQMSVIAFDRLFEHPEILAHKEKEKSIVEREIESLLGKEQIETHSPQVAEQMTKIHGYRCTEVKSNPKTWTLKREMSIPEKKEN